MTGIRKLKTKNSPAVPLLRHGRKLKTREFNSFRFFVLSFTFLLVCTLLFGGCALFGRGGGAKPSGVDEEKARLLKAIDRKFENPDAHFELGQSYQAEGRWAKAEREYKITLSFDPVHRRAQAARVKVLMSSGDKALAKILADEYVGQASNSALDSLRLAMAFQKEELDEYALSCYEQALQLAPNSAKINRQIGYYYLSKNEEGRARDYLSRSFQINPNQPDVAGELGRLGVTVRIPRKTEKGTKKLDKVVDQADKEAKP